MALASLLCTIPAWAEETWVEIEGQATLAGNTTPDEAARDAIKRAQARAIEQVTGAIISDDAFSVRDRSGQLRLFRETKSVTTGRITEQAIRGWRIESRSVRADEPPIVTYIVNLKAKVARDEPPDPGFRVALNLSATTLRSGEELKLTVHTTQDAYLGLFNLAADDRVYPLYPNPHTPVLKASPNQELHLPLPREPFALRPRTLPGHARDTEGLKVVACKDPLRLPPLKPGDRSMSITDFYRWLLQTPASRRAEETAEYTILE